MRREHLNRFLEFLVIGFLMGIGEDLIAVSAVSKAVIGWETVLVVALVALPFAAFSELVVDRKGFEPLTPEKDKRI